MTTRTLTARVGFTGLLMTGTLVLAQIAPTPPVQTPAPSAQTPAGAAPTVPPGAPAPGRGNRPPLSESDAAEIAKLESFPAWTPGAGDGNYFIGPEYAPAPELTPKDGVPKGRVETFTLTAADSKFYPGHRPARGDADAGGDGLHPEPVRRRDRRPADRVLRCLRGAQQPAADDSRQHDRGAKVASDHRGDDRQRRRRRDGQ